MLFNVLGPFFPWCPDSSDWCGSTSKVIITDEICQIAEIGGSSMVQKSEYF